MAYLIVKKPMPVHVSELLEDMGFETPSDVGSANALGWETDFEYATQMAEMINSSGEYICKKFPDEYNFPLAIAHEDFASLKSETGVVTFPIQGFVNPAEMIPV